MKVEHTKTWDHILYRDGERLLLSVLCGTIGIYEISIELNAEEMHAYEAEGTDYIQFLANRVRSDNAGYMHRRVEIDRREEDF